MVSAWTVALAYQTCRQLSEICRRAGEDARARRLDAVLERMRADFHEYLMPGGTVASIAPELRFANGLRLMSEAAPYHGGCERLFKRAETAANVGREIGLQYVHARGWRVPAEELSAVLGPERNLVGIEL